jgi:hypothetical protein
VPKHWITTPLRNGTRRSGTVALPERYHTRQYPDQTRYRITSPGPDAALPLDNIALHSRSITVCYSALLNTAVPRRNQAPPKLRGTQHYRNSTPLCLHVTAPGLTLKLPNPASPSPRAAAPRPHETAPNRYSTRQIVTHTVHNYTVA